MSKFWDDLAEDMEDPEFREAYEKESRKLMEAQQRFSPALLANRIATFLDNEYDDGLDVFYNVSSSVTGAGAGMVFVDVEVTEADTARPLGVFRLVVERVE